MAETMRRDTARNRQRILDVARDLSASGEPLQLNTVARIAEVGVGTVYRHFPTPEALREGLVEQRFVDLVEFARTIEHDDPVTALRTFLERALTEYADDAAFAAVSSSPAPVRPETAALRAELVGVFTTLVDEAASRLRPGLDGTDLLVLVCGVGYAARLRPGRVPQYLDALLSGVLA